MRPFWIYLSPHLDDVALSCGGLLWEQAQRGERVWLWTLCAGDPPPGDFSPFAQALHASWGTGEGAAAQRRSEDRLSCDRLGVEGRHFPLPDAIYRRQGSPYWPRQTGGAPSRQAAGDFFYPSPEALFGELHPQEESLIEELAALLRGELPPQAILVCPLTIGGHVDHRLTRRVAERLGRPLWYYADYPYAAEMKEPPERQAGLLPSGYRRRVWRLTSAALQAWGDSIAAHRSQIRTFWADERAMRAALLAYYIHLGGAVLWSPP